MTPVKTSSVRRFAALMALGLASLCVERAYAAGEGVTSVTYGTLENGPDSTRLLSNSINSIAFNNLYAPVSSVTTSSGSYTVSSLSSASVYFRRSVASSTTTVAALAGTPYFASASVTLAGTDYTTASSLFLSRTTTSGLYNPFVNSTTGSNIERIDVYLGGSYVVQTGDSIVFFVLGNSDSFKIAAITGWADGTATSYAPTLATVSVSGSALSTVTGGSSYYNLSLGTGDTLSSSTTVDNGGATTSSSLYAVVVKLSDLGLSAGNTIYGYSIVSSDVSITSSTNELLNISGAAYSGSTSSSVDFMGFGSATGRPVPEPATYGLIFSGLGVFSYGCLRFRRGRRSASV